MRSRIEPAATTSPTSPTSGQQPRRPYIDWARAIAVLIMIQAHVLDAWTAPSARSSRGFAGLHVIGGFAAPLFLFLAGVAVVLAAESRCGREGRQAAWQASVARGLEIFVLAFVFRLQSFVLGLGRAPLSIFRVDILNVMGVSLVAAALLWGATGRRRHQLALFAVVSLAIAMTTPILRAAGWVASMPVWTQWYIRPAGEHTTFTLFPWSGFVFAGAALGAALGGALERSQERRLHASVAVAGATLVSVGFYTASLPSIYANSSFWTSSPTFFVVRVGVMLIAVSILFHLAQAGVVARVVSQWMIKLGRSSLLVYWVHVELVYGALGFPLKSRLSLEQALLAWLALVVLMTALVTGRDRVSSSWRRAKRLDTAHAA